MPGAVSTRPILWPMRTTPCAVPTMVESQARRAPLSLLRYVPNVRPFDAFSARVKRDPRLSLDLMPKYPDVVHELTRNAPLLPRVDPVIAGQQTIGGMSGMMILSLRKNLQFAKFLDVQQRPRSTGWRPVPKPPRLPWDFVDPPSEPSVVHQLMPNAAVMPWIQPVIPALAGGMTGWLILTLRAKLRQAGLFKRVPPPKKASLPWAFLRETGQPKILHAIPPVIAQPSAGPPAGSARRRRFASGWTRQ